MYARSFMFVCITEVGFLLWVSNNLSMASFLIFPDWVLRRTTLRPLKGQQGCHKNYSIPCCCFKDNSGNNTKISSPYSTRKTAMRNKPINDYICNVYIYINMEYVSDLKFLCGLFGRGQKFKISARRSGSTHSSHLE